MTTRMLFALVLAAAACSSGGRAVQPQPQPEAPRAVATPPAAPAERPAPQRAPEPSIYDLDVALLGTDGEPVPLDVGRGHPTLISMFYGSCSTACPALLGRLKQIANEAGPDTRVVLVSFDPARDTPERIAELVAIYKLDARWTLASAADADARTLAAVLGIKYRPTASGEFFHNSVIVALDRDGSPIERMIGLGDHTHLLAALAR